MDVSGDGTPGKKPPAPSKTKLQAGNIKAQIAREIYVALKKLGAGEELLSVVDSWRDTLSDGEVLHMLQEFNAGRPTLRPLT